MFDLTIRGGRVVDGTGSPARRADVGLRAGRIAAVGDLGEDARETLDADGRVVAPGFVDLHTHYDAQVFWDPSLSPSVFHGVTSVFAGNCGFSIAPLEPEAADYLMRMLARVEGMPLESLRQGVPWDWRTTSEYLAKITGRVAVNAGFLVGHSALRRVVMGRRSVGESATPDELEAMLALLRRCILEGGLGFSSSLAPTHNDADGRPVPSRHADREELLALAGVLRELPGTVLEFIPGIGAFSEDQIELMIELSLAADRPLNWNLHTPNSASSGLSRAQLAASDRAAERGATLVALTLPQPVTLRVNFRSGFVLDAFPGWAALFELPAEERKRRLRDAAFRSQLDASATSPGAGPLRALADWANMVVDQVSNPELAPLRGCSIGELATSRGVAPFDCLLDVALADDLKASFTPPTFGTDDASWRLRAEAWRDARTVVGGSDAGAHLDMIDTFAFSTQLLQNARERGLLSLEEAVHQLTQVPARLYGLRDRGRLAPGAFADLVIFDPATVGSEETYVREDLPGGAGRLYADARGIGHVIVNGVEVVRNGELTGATPGAVLRPGADTQTVRAGA